MKRSLILLLVAISGCTSPQPAPIAGNERALTASSAAVSAAAVALDDGMRDANPAVRTAIERALPFLQREGTAWMEGRVSIQEGSACVSCHHVGYAMWSHAEARRVGIDAHAPAFRALAETAIAFLDQPSIPRAMSVGQVVFAEPQQATSLRHRLIELQSASGDWSAQGQFPTQRRPIAESDTIATMYALLALHQLGGEDADDAPHAKALAWLDDQSPGESTEWLAWRLVLMQALGAEDEVAALRRDLTDRQHPDGGWGWTADVASNVFSTGQALYALALVPDGVASGTPAAVEHAVRFLIESQDTDGTWRTASSVVSLEPSAEKDVIYHFWGTAWATIGLARSLAS